MGDFGGLVEGDGGVMGVVGGSEGSCRGGARGDNGGDDNDGVCREFHGFVVCLILWWMPVPWVLLFNSADTFQRKIKRSNERSLESEGRVVGL